MGVESGFKTVLQWIELATTAAATIQHLVTKTGSGVFSPELSQR
jgi:hypothetical protein